MSQPCPQVAQITYRYDCLRGAFQGILDAGWMTFLVLISIRVFDASSTIKACIASSGFWGYLLNPLMVATAAWTGLRTSSLASYYYLGGGILMLASAFAPNLWIYATMVMAWQFVSCQVAPLMIQVYSDNYTPSQRGTKCSTQYLMASIGGSLFSYFGGRCLDINIHHYRNILLVIAFASWIACWVTYKIPSQPLKEEHTGSAFANFSLLWTDSLFSWISIAWTLISLAQWMFMPIQIEYLANPMYGWSASNQQIAVVTFMVPALSKIASIKLWGYAFDRFNFMLLRLMINGCVMGGILVFFHANDMIFLGLGSALIGIGGAGGMLTTNIWVTKIAIPEKVSSYMSAHAALSGLRGLLAPFIGYLFLKKTDPITVSWVAAAMGFASMLMFWHVKSHPRITQLR